MKIKAVRDTIFKTKTLQADLLANGEQTPIAAGTEFPIVAIREVGTHLLFTLGKDNQGKQINVMGRNTLYAFRPHVEVINGGSRRINAAGLQLLKDFEGLELEAYICPAGVLTIGYGETENVYPGQHITEKEAEAMLLKSLKKYEAAVTDSVKMPLSENQYSALVCFVYNIGIGAFQDSTLLRLLNQGDYSGAAAQFLRWDKAGGQALPGLTRRRKAEQALFLEK